MKDSFRLLISKDRKSRDEIIKAIASAINTVNTEDIEPTKKGLKRR